MHYNNGKLFLAHPYQYGMKDTKKFIKELYDEYSLDGIEAYYTTFSKKQTKYLIDFAKKRKLLLSGGSDYHGKNKQKHNLGIGNGSLRIDARIVEKWDVNFFI